MYKNVQTREAPASGPCAGREAAREAAPRTVVVHRQLISCCRVDIVLYRIVLCDRLRERRRESQIDSDAEEEEEKCGRRD